MFTFESSEMLCGLWAGESWGFITVKSRFQIRKVGVSLAFRQRAGKCGNGAVMAVLSDGKKFLSFWLKVEGGRWREISLRAEKRAMDGPESHRFWRPRRGERCGASDV
jgi:hypothetical protein